MPGTYRAVITGLRSADDYLRVSAALQNGLGGARAYARSAPAAIASNWTSTCSPARPGLIRMLGSDSPIEAVTLPTDGPVRLEGERMEFRLK